MVKPELPASCYNAVCSIYIMKVLITGASGLLGRAIFHEAQNRHFEVIGLAFSRAGSLYVKCDLTNHNEVEETIQKFKPEFIVHAAAERFPDKVEKEYEQTRKLNIESSRKLSQVANSVGSKIIYISTDYVFDGTSPPYKIDDIPNPLNKYGQTKYDGEKAVLTENSDASVLRIPILYGKVERLDESAVTCLLSMLLNKDKQLVSHYEKRYPSYTQDIARIICDLIIKLKEEPSLSGIFHWSGKECLTKYDMVCSIGNSFGLSTDHITPDCSPSGGTTRPVDAQLDNSRLEKLGISHHTPFADGIKESLNPWI